MIFVFIPSSIIHKEISGLTTTRHVCLNSPFVSRSVATPPHGTTIRTSIFLHGKVLFNTEWQVIFVLVAHGWCLTSAMWYFFVSDAADVCVIWSFQYMIDFECISDLVQLTLVTLRYDQICSWKVSFLRRLLVPKEVLREKYSCGFRDPEGDKINRYKY